MILQDAIRAFENLTIKEASKKYITRPDGDSSRIKLGYSNQTGDPDIILLDLDNDKNSKEGYYWVTLRIDEVMADDWFITSDDEKDKTILQVVNGAGEKMGEVRV